MPNLGPIIRLPSDPREAAIKEMAEAFAQGYREKEEKADLERAMKEIGEAESLEEAFKVAPPSGIQTAQDIAAWNAIIKARHPTTSVKPQLVSVYDEEGNETKEWLTPGQQPSSGLTMTKPGKKQEWYSSDFKPMGSSPTRPEGGMTLEEMREARQRKELAGGGAGKPTDKDKAISDFIADTEGLENNARGRKIARNLLFKTADAENVLKRSYFEKLPGGEWSLSGDADKRQRYYYAQRRTRELMLQGKDPRPAAMEARKEADEMEFKSDQQPDTTMQPRPVETGIGDKILGMLSRDGANIQALPRDPATRQVGAKYKHPNGQIVEWDGKQLIAVEE